MGVWGRVFDEWELMPVMVRVEKIKNLRNKACLPSLLLSDVSRVLGWWFPYFFALGKAKKNKEKKRKKNKEITTKVPKTHQISKKREGRQALFCKFLNFSALAITGINSHSNSCKMKDSPQAPTAWVACGYRVQVSVFSEKYYCAFDLKYVRHSPADNFSKAWFTLAT